MADRVDAPRHPSRLPAVWVALMILATGALLGWAVTEVLRPDDSALAESPFVTATVKPGEVAQSLKLNASAEWQLTGTVANRAAGTVTSVDLVAGAEVTNGQRLYSVDGRPVHAAAGAVPMYRDLTVGVWGADVAQLQRMLSAAGLDPGRTDGVFEARTARSVRDWQERSGLPADGVVGLRDLVFVGELPTRARLDDAVLFVGAIVGGGEPALTRLGAPRFSIALDDLQDAMVQLGADVVVTGPNAEWAARVGERSHNDRGTSVALESDTGPLCGAQCADVPPFGTSLFPARITVVPSTSGASLPSAAIATRADGRAIVVDSEGAQHPVTVAASAQGVSIVEGVREGLVVRVPAEVPSTTP